MKIPIERQSDKPLYLQIRDRLQHLIQSGTLAPGQQLPSIRNLADTIQVNKLTVIEAYGMLEAEGLIHARQGAGYFVNPPLRSVHQRESTFAPAQSVIIPQQSGGSFYNIYTTMLKAHQEEDFINFGLGIPHPPEDMARMARRAMTGVGETLFNYEHPQGLLSLRRQIAQMLIQLGLEVSADDLMITTGSQQGLFLALHHYVRPGDWVIVESPTYYGFLSMLESLGAKVIGIPMAAEGMNLNLLEQYLQSHRPRLIYTISTLHNPTGITTTQSHRAQLLALAERYECPVLEDNAYEGLSFEPVPPPIKALDTQGWVTYLGTFSKTLMPGLRVGYMVMNPRNKQALLEQKLLQDLSSSTVAQAIVSEYLASGHYRRHVNRLQANYLQSRNVMLQAMETHFPEEATWTVPKGGLFLWVQLPDEVSVPDIYQAAIAQKIVLANGTTFFPGEQGYPALRLSFLHGAEAIERGIAILGKILKQHARSRHLVGRSQTAACRM